MPGFFCEAGSGVTRHVTNIHADVVDNLTAL